MPNTITYSSLSNVIPQQRLLMFEKVFQTTDPIEVHGAYIWTVKVAASLLPLLSTFEVALRNAIHTCATKNIGLDWYDILETKVRTKFHHGQRDQNNISWHFGEVARIKQKIAGKTPPIGLTKHDLLVAKMDFGFWDNLLRECFSKNNYSNALWPKYLNDVFPNLPKNHTNAIIQKEVSALRELRNEISHHSPIWKKPHVVDETTAITYINSQIDKIVDMINWLSKDVVNWIDVHMLQAEARRMATKEFLYLCQRKNMQSMEIKCSTFKRQITSKLRALDKDSFTIIKHNEKCLYVLTKISVR
ncbi:Abi family protein [Acinetobacter pittii]|uniref:Abi family protein n=1 Tax=Acinetobacter pittii TaxID=48296 RepID=UPI001BDBA952|nr:Abi family protein [Acinetobacter pittii]